MDVIDWLTVAAAVLAFNVLIRMLSAWPFQRTATWALFALLVGVTAEYGRTALVYVFDVPAWGYGSMGSLITRSIVVGALLVVNYIMWTGFRGKLRG